MTIDRHAIFIYIHIYIQKCNFQQIRKLIYCLQYFYFGIEQFMSVLTVHDVDTLNPAGVFSFILLDLCLLLIVGLT